MRKNPLNLRVCLIIFGVCCALGLACGLSRVDNRITGAFFLGAYAAVLLGAFWNLLFYIATSSERRSQRWAAQDRCPSCGYDLRDNQSGVCPECGTRIWD